MPFGVPEVSEVLPEHVCGEGSIAKRSPQVDVEPIDLSSYSEITVYNLPRLLFWLAIVCTIWIYLEFCLFLCAICFFGFYIPDFDLGLEGSRSRLPSLDSQEMGVLWRAPTVQLPSLHYSVSGGAQPPSQTNGPELGKPRKIAEKRFFFIWIYILLWLHKAPGTIASSLRASVGSSFLTELLTWAFRLYLPSTRNINDISKVRNVLEAATRFYESVSDCFLSFAQILENSKVDLHR